MGLQSRISPRPKVSPLIMKIHQNMKNLTILILTVAVSLARADPSISPEDSEASAVFKTKPVPQLDSALLNGLASVSEEDFERSPKAIPSTSLVNAVPPTTKETNDMPSQVELPVKLYLSPEWREFDPFGSNATR